MNPHTKGLPISLSFLECFYRINILFTTAVSSGKCDEKYPFNNNSGNIHLCLSVLLFHFSVSWFSEIQFHMLHLETWASIACKPTIHSGHLNFVLVSLFIVEHARDPVLFPAKGQGQWRTEGGVWGVQTPPEILKF